MGELDDYSLDQVAGALALVLGSLGGLCLILFKPEPEPEPEPEPIIPNNNP